MIHFPAHSRLQGMPFTPGSYKPIADDEFAVVIFCTKHEQEKALKLKHELETVQDIKPISINAEDWETSRTIILLLSKHTQTQEGKAPSTRIRIFLKTHLYLSV